MKTKFYPLFVLVSIFVVQTNSILAQSLDRVPSNLHICNIDNEQEVYITNDDLSNFMKNFGESNMKFTELQIHKIAETYYLLAYEVKKEEVYAFELTNKKQKRVLQKRKYVNSCQTNHVSPSIFRLEDGKVVGCNNSNHSIRGSR